MTSIPRLATADSTIAFLREGYNFTTTRCRHLGTDAFRTRLMLSPVTCAYGQEAAEVFYAKDRFTRRGAMPSTTVKLLQGFGSVQTLDGAPHRARKQMFLRLLMGEAAITRLVAVADEEWQAAEARWPLGARISLLDEAALILSKTALRWLGLSPKAEAAGARARESLAMIKGAGTIGPLPLTRGLLLRARSEEWARRVIRDVRAGRLAIDQDAPIHILSNQADEEGKLLSPDVAALELLNLVRPIVAVAVFIVHAALAFREHPEWRERIAAAPRDAHDFVQEVRRLAPFFPVIAGKVMEPFKWRGKNFDRGD